MTPQLKINTLRGWSQLTENILKTVADFNASGGETTITALEEYVRHYNGLMPKGVFNYNTIRHGDRLNVYADDELLLSLTMCEMEELVMENENY